MNNQQNGPRQAATIAEYLEHVAEIKNRWSYPVLAFRGQKDKDWRLESAAERRLKNNGKGEDRVAVDRFNEYHQDLIKKCKLKNYDKREGKQLHDLEILADLRHHGGAVCLIDFTRNALVALWFACENSNKDGGVFVVNTADEKTFLEIVHTDIEDSIERILAFETRKTDKDQEEKLQRQETLAASQDKPNFWHWTPAHLNERITAQRSLFVFGVPSSNEPSSKKIIIKSKNKDQIRQELKEIHGIHEESLFPDFVGFAYTHRIDAPYEILDAEEYARRGLEAQQQGDFEQAIQYYDKAINLNPNYAIAYFYRGNAYGNKGELDQAIQDFTKAIDLNPNDAKAYNNRGIAYGTKDDFDLAIQDFTKAIDLDPNYAKAYFYRGIAYSDKGELDQAIQDYDKAIDLNPNDAKAYFYRGNAYSNKGDFDQAIQDYDKAIELDPQLAEVYNNRGNAYSDKGDFDQATQDYDEAIDLNPNDAKAYNNRGVAYSDKGDLDRAIQDYDKAIDLNPNDAKAYNNRGNAYSNKGELDQAIQDFTEAIDLDPNDAIAYFFRGIVGSILSRWENARADLTAAKNMGMDIAVAFHRQQESIADFERKYNIRLPADIADMLA